MTVAISQLYYRVGALAGILPEHLITKIDPEDTPLALRLVDRRIGRLFGERLELLVRKKEIHDTIKYIGSTL